LRLRDKAVHLSGRTRVMGILNVTPDSFSDGGRFATADRAVACGLQMVQDGADLVDIGGESTRPGAASVAADEQLRRVLPVLRGIRRQNPEIAITVDTTRASVAVAVLESGADGINDVSAGRDDARMFEVVAAHEAGLVLMHMQGRPRTMQDNPQYEDVVREVQSFLAQRAAAAQDAGISPDHIAIDPGLGFGKTLAHNLELVRQIAAFHELGYPILLGPSRKTFIGQVLGIDDAQGRVVGTAAVAAWAAAAGVQVLRVHDVGEIAQITRMIAAIVGDE
jgi:dihydropteroate synthase